MSDEQDLLERRLSREDAAQARGGRRRSGPPRQAGSERRGAALDRLTAESGRLQVLDWAGYGNDGGQSMFAQYVKKLPAATSRSSRT